MRFLLSFTTVLAALTNVGWSAPVVSSEISTTNQDLISRDVLPSYAEILSIERRAAIPATAQTDKFKVLYDAATKAGASVEAGNIYCVSMMASAPSLHAQLLVGPVTHDGTHYDWAPVLYQLVLNPADKKKVLAKDATWDLRTDNKYKPTFSGKVASKWTREEIVAEAKKLETAKPLYCKLASVLPGFMTPKGSQNCHNFADDLWDVIKG